MRDSSAFAAKIAGVAAAALVTADATRKIARATVRRGWPAALAFPALALSVLTLGLAATPAHAGPVSIPWPGGTTGILGNPASGMVMDVPGSSRVARAAVQTWPVLGADNQRWTLRTTGPGLELRSVNSGMCADVQWGRTDQGAPVWQWPCTGSPAQIWIPDTFRIRRDGVRTGRFRDLGSGECLTVVNIAAALGKQLQQLDCVNGDSRQEWTLLTSPPGSSCTMNWPSAFPARAFRAAGNRNTFWRSPAGDNFWPSSGGFLAGDLLRFTAVGSTQIATWGDHKSPAGDTRDLAPDNGRWPLPGAPKYGLLMRIRSGSATGFSGRLAGVAIRAGQWHYIGADSGCLMVDGPPPAAFEFLINDDNVGDNNDGPDMTARQWRQLPYYGGA